MGKTTKFWKGVEELAPTTEYTKTQANEFAENIPVDQFLGDSQIENSSTSRRDFLKFLGFSVTAASLAACETPVNKAIPYVVRPEEITPGVANWYASTYFDGIDYAPVLVKTREGRPIKIEGNTLSSLTKGGTNARIQASVLSLYDSARITGPYASHAPSTWESVDKEIGKKLGDIAAKGGKIRILSSTIISPSTKAVIAEFNAKYGAKHVTYDAVSYSSIAKAHSNTHDKHSIPTYNFDKAKVIVSLGSDFLVNGISPVEHARQYSAGRKISAKNLEMSKHYQVESIYSLTGANADVRMPVKPSEIGIAVLNLYNAVASATGGYAVASSALGCDEELKKAAKDLVANKGKSLVVCGVNDTAIQTVVNNINTLLGNYGTTVDIENHSNLRQGNDAEFIRLIEEMGKGEVAALITYNTNPVYTTPAKLNFEAAYAKVGLKISFADRIDETASLADYVCPDNHYLESWNDANPHKAHYSLTQPTITQIFSKPNYEGTRQAQQTLLLWAGNTQEYKKVIQNTWSASVFPMQGKHMMFGDFWNNSLHDGYIVVGTRDEVIVDEKQKQIQASVITNRFSIIASPTVEDVVTPTPKMSIADAASEIKKNAKGGTFEAVLYETTALGVGNQANNPWLQELPDPMTKVTWDNYVTMSPLDMKDKGYSLQERQDREASVINVTVDGKAVTLPVYPMPGQARGTIGIALGYGRNKAGQVADKMPSKYLDNKNQIGENVFPFAQVIGGTVQTWVGDVQLSEQVATYELAGTQIHHTLMDRDSLIKTTTFEAYKSNPAEVYHEHLIPTHTGPKKPNDVTLWDNFDRPGHKWAMSIDLTSCIGCGSCVVSCNAENNVAVVGRDQVRKTREMHWLRIDRYFESDMTKEVAKETGVGSVDMYLQMEQPSNLNPKVVFQPVMCQHCNHAPCETVCPVIATNHSSEGLNMMTYNRCVGTRYCANNCPFKVRRFNWFNYNGNSDYAGINPTQDDIGRMVLNPDVVVRSRGVMEKCSMCVQRIQGGKLDAKKGGRKLMDGEIKTACQQSCPTDAISFGDVNDESTAISDIRKDARTYFMLEEIGIQPTVSYLTKVRNIEGGMVHGGHHAPAEHKEEHKTEEKHS